MLIVYLPPLAYHQFVLPCMLENDLFALFRPYENPVVFLDDFIHTYRIFWFVLFGGGRTCGFHHPRRFAERPIDVRFGGGGGEMRFLSSSTMSTTQRVTIKCACVRYNLHVFNENCVSCARLCVCFCVCVKNTA